MTMFTIHRIYTLQHFKNVGIPKNRQVWFMVTTNEHPPRRPPQLFMQVHICYYWFCHITVIEWPATIQRPNTYIDTGHTDRYLPKIEAMSGITYN